MGTLASELRPIASDLADAPRVYVDANLPAGLVAMMRQELHWDVLFVMEHDELRRAKDDAHFRKAGEFGRTLISLDHDFLDSKRFPLDRSPGVVILSAPDERGLAKLLRRLHRTHLSGSAGATMPLRGQVITLEPEVRAPGG